MLAILFRLFILTVHAANVPDPAIQQNNFSPFNGGNPTFEGIATFILHWLTNLAYPLALIAIVYSAYLLISSSGNPDAYVKVKKNVLYLLTGVFLIVFTVIFINLIVSFFNYTAP